MSIIDKTGRQFGLVGIANLRRMLCTSIRTETDMNNFPRSQS